jgi:hypothetical protein
MSLNDLPAEVILDHLLPELSTRDLFTISRVNREFHALAVSITCLPAGIPLIITLLSRMMKRFGPG